MKYYFIRRILLIFPTLLGIVTLTFIILQFVPGGPIEQIISEIQGYSGSSEVSSSGDGYDTNSRVSQEQIDEIRKLYGFDQPIYVQYFNWLIRLFTFDFGDSYFYNRSVIDLIAEKLPVSASLGIISFLLVYLISIPLGIKKAISPGSKFDIISSFIILIGYSIPGFIVALFLIVFFAGGSFFSWFPIRGLTSDNFADLNFIEKILDYIWHLVLPIIAYMLGAFAVLSQRTRNLFLEEMQQQYVITARAKGLSEKVILSRHILKNAMILIISAIPAHALGMFFVGSLLIEKIFSLDGIGLLNYESILRRDYAVVMSMLFITSIIALVGQVLTDMTLAIIDPRITFDKNVK